MGRTLALDIGNRRIGVAVSDVTKLIATPFGIIDRKFENALERLREIVAQQQPDEIVIGMPLNGAGQSGEQAQRTEAFTQEIRAAIALPIRYHDERFSSAEARAIIAEKKRAKQPQHDDAIAASVILQRYLNLQRDLINDALEDAEYEEEEEHSA